LCFYVTSFYYAKWNEIKNIKAKSACVKSVFQVSLFGTVGEMVGKLSDIWGDQNNDSGKCQMLRS
jgi:hypothetical protein